MPYSLKTCVWEITLACSFSCRYCGSAGGKAREGELSTEECLSVCDQLAAMGCRRVSLIGGEVFMRPDWDVIAKRLSDHSILVCIITNGYLFTPQIIERLRNCLVESIAVSLDGPQEIHDAYRQKGSYERAVQAIETLTKEGFPVSVISTLHKGNVPYLESFYETLKQYPIFAWQLQACSPMGNAANGGIDIRFDVNEVMDFVQRHMWTAPFALGIADNIGYFREDEGYLRGNLSGKAVFRGCAAGLSNIGIDSVGNIKGCEALYDPIFIEGNLRTESLRTIWEDPERFAYNRHFKPAMLTGTCAACERGAQCAGGCRSYNYFVHHKMYEAPNCVRNIIKEQKS